MTRAPTATFQSLQTQHAYLLALVDRLDRHFRREEQECDLVAAVKARVPQLADECQRVVSQHKQMLQELDAIALKLSEGLQVEALKDDFSRFASTLKAHEQKEAELLLKAKTVPH
jgi:hypothetical protein